MVATTRVRVEDPGFARRLATVVRERTLVAADRSSSAPGRSAWRVVASRDIRTSSSRVSSVDSEAGVEPRASNRTWWVDDSWNGERLSDSVGPSPYRLNPSNGGGPGGAPTGSFERVTGCAAGVAVESADGPDRVGHDLKDTGEGGAGAGEAGAGGGGGGAWSAIAINRSATVSTAVTSSGSGSGLASTSSSGTGASRAAASGSEG